ncbi:hypothetical protein RDWZM_000550 [Blomia tropicalis]|uniref:Charged multivesicular body protein 3 n=1 Tax=Blomia tropicalis TaxID=40697 RepID=A0A9Q0MDZ4_BLOTA|nr:Charged multivesicular body protein 3 [Blomia tropicalis]KAJ6222005.1 hypothetical protein RDWZM_000550 [Blomia tropicalis]
MGLFGKDPKVTPKEQVREWTSKLRKQQMLIDRQIRAIQREEEKVKMELKKAAKQGNRDVCLVFAKEIVNSRKGVSRLHTTKAHLNSIMMNMNQQLSALRISNSLEKSTDVMRSMQSLIKVGEVAQVMQEMSREMMRAGIIDEMLEETLEDTLGGEDMEEEANEEVDKVLFEITNGQLGKGPAVPSDSLPTIPEKESKKTPAVAEDEDISEMQQRLEALRS